MAQSTAAAKGNGATPAQIKTPRAFGDHTHMELVVDYLKRALKSLADLDEAEQRDTLFRIPRKAAEAFVEQCGHAVPDPDAQPAPTTEG